MTYDSLPERMSPQQRKREEQRQSRLFLRNILNVAFIVVALVAMVGVVVAKKESVMTWYMVGLVAVVIKMVEVMLRMPGFRK